MIDEIYSRQSTCVLMRSYIMYKLSADHFSDLLKLITRAVALSIRIICYQSHFYIWDTTYIWKSLALFNANEAHLIDHPMTIENTTSKN
jgi:hypothetical protein